MVEGMGIIFLRQNGFKNFVVIVTVVIAFLFLHIEPSIADSVAIKSVMKIQRMGRYVILINYETCDKWTDNLVFKMHCRFDEGEFTFLGSSLSNIERGWHKTEIAIPEAIKKRYGPLQEYKIDLYRDGALVDTKKSY